VLRSPKWYRPPQLALVLIQGAQLQLTDPGKLLFEKAARQIQAEQMLVQSQYAVRERGETILTRHAGAAAIVRERSTSP
jgi:hypothetical protein